MVRLLATESCNRMVRVAHINQEVAAWKTKHIPMMVLIRRATK
jgi:hypothetical protein